VTSNAFRLELFGAPRVLQRGAEVRLPIRKSLALLAYLAVEGRTTRAKLAALFWGESGDEAARRNLRRELHRLREAGLAEAIATDDQTVALAPGVESDVAEFAAAESSRPEVALALYRGPLLDGFEVDEAEGFETWLAARREHYAQRWSQSAGAEATRLTAQGDPRAALALHLRLIEADALQEAQFVAAMRLASQLGERSRALELYERCRATLQRELGLEPLPDTTALAEQIRAAERLAPYAEPAVSAGLAELAAPCVGRDDVLDALRSAGARVRLIVGEPGVGKSRVADEYARGAATRLLIAGSELTRNAPLQAVTTALAGALADGRLQQYLQTLDDARRHELARVLPGLDGPQAQAEGAHSSSDSPAARKARLLEAVGAALRALAADGVIVFEDLHWADALTLDLVEDLAHRLARQRAEAPVIVITARAQELADHAAAQALMLRLERAQLLQRFDLAPLDAAATTELVQRLSGSSGGTVFAQRLQHATHGNPFFLLETIRFLFASGELAVDERGQWTTRYDEATSDYAELPVPPTIQQAVLERVARLGPAARRVLETAALAGDGFTLDEVQPATALSDWEALDGLERAGGASLIRGAERRYRFGHDLVRVALDGSLGAERRRLIHLRLADTLAARHAEAGRVAWHYDRAGERAAAAPWHLAAARAAEQVFAWRDAVAHVDRALSATDDPATSFDLHRQRFGYAQLLYDHAAMQADIEAMQQLVAGGGLPPAAEQQALVSVAEFENVRKRHEAAASAARAVLQFGAAPTSDLGFRSRMELGFALCELSGFDEGEAALREVLDHDPAPTPSQRARALRVLANITRRRQRPAVAAGYLEEAIAILTRTGEIEARAHAYNLLAFTQHVGGQAGAAIATLELALADAQRAQSVAIQKTLLLNLVKLCTMASDFPRAQAHLDTATDVLQFAADPATLALLDSRRAELALLQGQLGRALSAARSAIAHYEANRGGSEDYWPWYLQGRLLWHIGANEAALAVYRNLAHSPAATGSDFKTMAALLTEAFQLPAHADAVAVALQALRDDSGGAVEPGEVDYWRAYALNAAGHHAEAAAILAEIAPPQFVLHPASLVALRLDALTASGADTDAAAAAAASQLDSAPPLEQIELLAALVSDSERRGDTATAGKYRKRARPLIERLATSLEDAALRGSLLERRHNLLQH